MIHISDSPDGARGGIDGEIVLGEMVGDFVEQEGVEIGVVVRGLDDERLVAIVENDASDGSRLRHVALVDAPDEPGNVVVDVGDVNEDGSVGRRGNHVRRFDGQIVKVPLLVVNVALCRERGNDTVKVARF